MRYRKFKRGQKVWAAIAINPRQIIGMEVTYLGTRDGRFLRVEDEDGHRWSVAKFYVFATREELARAQADDQGVNEGTECRQEAEEQGEVTPGE